MGSAKMLRRASLLAAACMLALVARAQELGESKAAIPAMRPNALTGFMAAPAHHSDKEAEDVAESLIMDNEVQRDAKATDQKLSKTMQELIGKGKEAAAKVVALEKEKKVLEEEAIEEATDVQQHEKMLRDLQKALAKERADERAAKAPKRSPPAPKPRVRPEKMARDESRFEAAPEKFATKVKAPKESKPKEKKEKPLGLKLKKPVTTKESVTENAADDLKRLAKGVRDPATKAKEAAKKKAGVAGKKSKKKDKKERKTKDKKGKKTGSKPKGNKAKKGKRSKSKGKKGKKEKRSKPKGNKAKKEKRSKPKGNKAKNAKKGQRRSDGSNAEI